MANISQEELIYLKQTLSPKQLLELRELKNRIDNRKRKLGREVR